MITTTMAACGGILAGVIFQSLLSNWFFDGYQPRRGSNPAPDHDWRRSFNHENTNLPSGPPPLKFRRGSNPAPHGGKPAAPAGPPPLKLDPGHVQRGNGNGGPTAPKPGIIPKPQPPGGRLIREDQMPPCPDTIAAIRAADAAIADQALEAELRAWWRAQGWPAGPGLHAVQTHVAWARHLLSRGAGA